MIQIAIKVLTLSNEVYRQLREKICTGEIPPGERITIRDIASKFEVSTMPVREAIRRLQAEGFLQIDKRCAVVRKLSLKELQEIFVIRKRLETLAIEWALPNVKDKDINELKNILDEFDKEDIDNIEWQRINRKFHLSIYELSMSKPLNQLVKNVWDSVTPYMHIYATSPSSYKFSKRQHSLMIEYIEENKKEQLIKILINHLDVTHESIVHNIKNNMDKI
ncbi:GntR family transcriptional regulator [Sporolactobacillus sp. THM7-7]|nr:GntR family transcriptional regulator [Sporolactobacillus sp. THM7-7]